MHSFQINNLHRIAINIVIARHISRYVLYRDLGQDTQPYDLVQSDIWKGVIFRMTSKMAAVSLRWLYLNYYST